MRLETERLILRPFTPDDEPAYIAMGEDPEVMRFYSEPYSASKSRASLRQIKAHAAKYGFCFSAAELKTSGEFAGMIGLAYLDDVMTDAIPGHPQIEIGWRLRKEFWGQGFAPEGARACLAYAFETLKVPEVVAFTFRGNLPSQRVMEKIGMTRDPNGDFGHPKIAPENPVRPHVLYRIANPGGKNRL